MGIVLHGKLVVEQTLAGFLVVDPVDGAFGWLFHVGSHAVAELLQPLVTQHTLEHHRAITPEGINISLGNREPFSLCHASLHRSR